LLFTNRKKPATSTTKKEKALKNLGIKAAHIIGIEQVRAWLTASPEIWSSMGFDRFDKPLSFDRSDITEVITAFHASFGSKGTGGGQDDFSGFLSREFHRTRRRSMTPPDWRCASLGQ
jgi:hypothetical protein